MRYSVRALENGQLVSLAFDAADAAEAERLARARGGAVLSVQRSDNWRQQLMLRRQDFDLVLFSQELLALLDAGINVTEAIETLGEKELRPKSRTILSNIREHLHDGLSFSAALQRMPEIFPPLYIATARASERTGDLAEGLGRYIAYAAQLNVVRKKLINASIYPMVLILAGSLVMIFLLGFVVPRFSRIYADLGGDLPLLSRLLMQWGHLVAEHGFIFLAALFAIALVTYQAIVSPAARRLAIDRLWAIPAVGERLRVYQLARFYRTLGMLLRGGIPITTAIDMVSGLLQPTYRTHLAAAAARIQEGRSISVAFEENQLTTPVALRMLRVGERGGRMGDMMERIAAFHDDTIGRWVDWFTRLFEPVLMALIGVLIGVIVVLMYLPIFELAGGLR